MAVPVIDIAQMRAWEAATWASGVTESEVIEKAGKAVAEIAMTMTQKGHRVLVVAGKGHNGDDARVASRNLPGRKVTLLSINTPELDLPILVKALAERPNLILDGLFGIGLSRPLRGIWAEVVLAINQTGTRVLAVDVPSGLNADTGEVPGVAIRAHTTVTLGAPKIGLLKSTAWPCVGRLEVAADIGLAAPPPTSELQFGCAGDFLSYPPRRLVSSHKGSHGHLLVLAGSVGYHGAAVLAAQAALRARPGLVTVVVPKEVYGPVAGQLRAAMVFPWHDGMSFPESCTAVLFGPGLASPEIPEEFRSAALRLWENAPMPVLVDASALDWLLPRHVTSQAIRCLTPHPGEAARLLKAAVTQVQANRLGALRLLSERYGDVFVVLKGHQTLIGRSQGTVYVNPSGNPGLGQGGSGDILAGYLAGLLAQPDGQMDALKTLRFGVWQHGATADFLEATRPNWVIDDLLSNIGSRVVEV